MISIQNTKSGVPATYFFKVCGKQTQKQTDNHLKQNFWIKKSNNSKK